MAHNNFKREHESFSISINASVEKIFPLACPVEELKWINGWDYTMVYSDSGKNENNCIFTENMSAQHIMGTEKSELTYWVTTLYDQANQIIHFVLLRSSTVTKLEIVMKTINPQESTVTWDMTITAINGEAGSVFNETLKERMMLMMTFLGHSLKHYCETGTILVFNK
jgi:uncharacterized membrane protein